ncbi:MAG TPA: glycosyltransferase family 2 protein [Edaphobacter sp.]|nr:glycosyltransferase family 2 protein [Edaphobacter sp.]
MKTNLVSDSSDGIRPEVSVVMPCLNEAETLPACIAQIQGMFAEHNFSGEIVVADNGSSDGSQAIAERMGARVVRISRRGYGSALMGGIDAASGKYVIMGDSDCSYDFGHVPRFIEKLRDGNDIVMGNRFKGGIRAGAMPALHKYLGNPALTGIGRLFFRVPCGDFHCGLRGFSKEAYKRMGLRTTGMEFASEMVVKATLFSLRIAEVPTTLSPDGRKRPPHLRSWHDGWRHLRFLLLYSPRWLFLYPGLILMILGTLVTLLLLPGPWTVGSVRFDVGTLVYASMSIMIGFQSVAFALLTNVFAISEGLLPPNPSLNRLFRYIRLETGLMVGFGLIAVGLTASFLAVGSWGATHFGLLDPERTLRLVIPATLSLALGSEVTLSSFFLSVLGMNRKDRVVPGLEPEIVDSVVEIESSQRNSNEVEPA